ncbi:rim15, signal transduction response regulator [Coemansia erecta]|uniref:non-specific serine/threonine protein kinase n=1 Tax=Coemansia erecta TaxID=147472 RepID=A0A9W8CSE1_9FUNG|nr:rim15, signal transduction response regulator [Coemansia erecta]
MSGNPSSGTRGGGGGGRSHSRRKRFGFFSIFGFHTDSNDNSRKNDDVSLDASGNNSSGQSSSTPSDRGGSQSISSSRRTSTSSTRSLEKSTEHSHSLDDTASRSSRSQHPDSIPGNDRDEPSAHGDGGDVAARHAASEALFAMSKHSSARLTPQPINIANRGDRRSYREEDNAAASSSIDMASEISGSVASSAAAMTMREDPALLHQLQHRGSQIRTCPIPERLRLHMRDTASESVDSNSPTITPSSVRAPVDTPRTLIESRVRRRDTIGSAVSAGNRESRRKAYGSDKVVPIGLSSAGDFSPRLEKTAVAMPVARRTSSNYSSWSAATPTSVFGTIAGDDVPQADYSSTLPDWDQQQQQQQQHQQSDLPSSGLRTSNTGKGRTRRYSVFDLSFANQRPSNTQPAQPSAIQPTPLHVHPHATGFGDDIRSRRRSSQRSIGDASLAGLGTSGHGDTAVHRQRRSGASSVDPTLFSTSPRFRQSSRSHVAIPFPDSKGSSGGGHSVPFGELPSGFSPNVTSAFSGDTSMIDDDEMMQGSGPNTPVSERESSASQGHRHQRHRRLFSADNRGSHDSSSGRSTPNHLLFARLRRYPSHGLQSAGAESKGNTSAGAGDGATSMSMSMSVSQQPHQAAWRSPTRGDKNTGLEGPPDSSASDMYLKHSTSVPDLLLMPIISHFGGQTRVIKRPDNAYEHMLAVSRSTKACRWNREKANNSLHRHIDSESGSTGHHEGIPSPQILSFTRRSTASTVDSHPMGVGISRRSSAQRPDSEAPLGGGMPLPVRPRRSTTGPSHGTDPACAVAWNDWIDDITGHSRSAVAHHVISMWQKILRSWNQKHRSRLSSFSHRRGSSASYISGSNNVPKTPTMFPSHGPHSGNGSFDLGTFSPASSSGATAMVSPFMADPTYLQRGFSESGRHTSPTNSGAYANICHVAVGGGLDGTQGLNISSKTASGSAFGLASGLSASTAPNSGKSSLSKEAGAGESASAEGGSDQPQQAERLVKHLPHHTPAITAPHRRLSVVKSQDLGIVHGGSSGSGGGSSSSSHSTPQQVHSVADNASHASRGSQPSSTGSSEKSTWMIAQLDTPEEAVEILLAFQQRLRLRLAKAKADSEGELVNIIQDLGEFVEEGLSYVNEDSANSSDAYPHSDPDSDSDDNDVFNARGVHLKDGYSSDRSIETDDGSIQTPGLEITSRVVPLDTSASENDVVARHQRHLPHHIHSRPDEQSATWELKSLNRRLQDVLSLHGDSSAFLLPPNPPEKSTDEPSYLELPPAAMDIGSTRGGSAEMSKHPLHLRSALAALPSPRRITRSPSIRRIAFLRALAGENTPAADKVPAGKAASGIRSRSLSDAALDSSSGSVFSTTEDSISSGSLSSTGDSAELSPQSQIRRPSTADLASLRSPVPNAVSPPIDGLQLTLGSTKSQSVGDIPFPGLKPKGSIQSMRPVSRSASPEVTHPYEIHNRDSSSSRHSLVERSSSRASVYSSAGSARSLMTSPLIAEDEFKPTPFLKAIMDLVNIIGHILSLSADDMLRPVSGQLLEEALEHVRAEGLSDPQEQEHECHRIQSMVPTEYLAQQLDILGGLWEQPPPQSVPQQQQQSWPCRGLFFRALLAISSLNRVVMWYLAVVSTYSDDIVHEVNRRSGLLSELSTTENDSGMPVGNVTPGSDNVSSAEILSARIPDASSEQARSDHNGLEEPPSQRSPASDHEAAASDRHTLARGYHVDHPPRWLGPHELPQNTSAVDKGQNMLLEIGLDGRIRYISPTCRHILGTDPTSLIDQQASAIFDEEGIQICRSAVEQLLADNTRTVEINVRVHSPSLTHACNVEAKGMLIYNRSKSEPSHVLWVMRYVSAAQALSEHPYTQPYPASDLELQQQQQQPQPQLDGAGEDWSANLPDVFEEQGEDVVGPPSPMEDITCRICDHKVPATYFEEHTWLCAQSHRAVMNVERQNDRLSDIKAEVQAWYPGCSVDDLEAMTHGDIDSDAMRERAQQKAGEIGDPEWQNLLDEAMPVIRSMVKICMRAMTLDASDATPQCKMPSSLDNDDSADDPDFVRSDNWNEVANYEVPEFEYQDAALESLGRTLVAIIRDKLSAIDNLQYAIVDSAEACSKWVLPDEDQELFSVPESNDKPRSDAPGPPETTETQLSGQPLPGTSRPTLSQQMSSFEWPDKQDTPPASQQSSVPTIQETSVSLGNTPLIAPVTEPNTSALSPQRSARASGSTTLNQMPVALRKTSTASSSSAASQGSSLRISTINLHPAPSRSAGRLSVSGNNSAFLATPTMPSIHDFSILKPISKGAYGSVFLAKKRTTGEYYAIKILKKADMIAKNQISNVKAERAIMMAQTGSPFVVRLLYTFQTRSSLYLVMEYLNGGDCASLLKIIGPLPLDWARQYLAEVVLGIEDLHKRNVVHRDLKPDNLLIDSEGHLKLTDFGLSKLGFLGRRVDQQTLLQSHGEQSSAQAPGLLVTGSDVTGGLPGPIPPVTSIPSSRVWQEYMDRPRSTTHQHQQQHQNQPPVPSKRISELKESSPLSNSHLLGGSGVSISSSTSSDSTGTGVLSQKTPTQKHALGTPDYIAPESILGLESGKSVDWWALGVICYEFIFGIPPFHDDTPEKVFHNILSADIDFYDDLRKQMAQEGGSDDEEGEIPDITAEARDFITRLLFRDPRRRLGSGGTAEVKAHPFFQGVNWSTLLDTQPAFVPQTENVEDTDYFDARGATLDAAPADLDPQTDDETKPGSSLKTGDTRQPVTRSLEVSSSLPVVSSGVSLHRSRTVPLPMADPRESSTETVESSERFDSVEPSTDEDPEFGAFTFKNLHALEQANMDELVKLRRRSTLLDMSSHSGRHTEGRMPSICGSSSRGSVVLPRTQRHHSCLEPPALYSNPSSPRLGSGYSTRELSSAHPHRGSLLNPGMFGSMLTMSTSHNSGSSADHPPQISAFSPDFSLPSTPSTHIPVSPFAAKLQPEISEPQNLDSVAHLQSQPIHHALTTNELPLESESSAEYLQSRVCLVADDNPVSCKIMEIILRRLHLNCVVVRNGAEAIRCAMGRTVFRAIFMDIGMPIVDGDEATRMIKSTYNANKDTPIVAMTAYDGEAANTLYDDAIVKPVSFDNVKHFFRTK